MGRLRTAEVAGLVAVVHGPRPVGIVGAGGGVVRGAVSQLVHARGWGGVYAIRTEKAKR
jgi:hypothetical protein